MDASTQAALRAHRIKGLTGTGLIEALDDSGADLHPMPQLTMLGQLPDPDLDDQGEWKGDHFCTPDCSRCLPPETDYDTWDSYYHEDLNWLRGDWPDSLADRSASIPDDHVDCPSWCTWCACYD